MKNVTTTYVKRLFWIALLPYLIGGGIFLTSASDRLFEKPSTPGTESSTVNDMDIQGNDPFIGEISMFAGNFAPRGWAFCNGDLLPISQNQALFSIIGTTYGGDGRTTFALPDLRGRVPVHHGGSRGPGLTERKLGAKFGSETLYFQTKGSAVRIQETTSTAERVPGVMQPSLGINYIIAIQWIYPSRN